MKNKEKIRFKSLNQQNFKKQPNENKKQIKFIFLYNKTQTECFK